MAHVTFASLNCTAETRVFLVLGSALTRAVGKLLAETTGHWIIENHDATRSTVHNVAELIVKRDLDAVKRTMS